MQTTRRLPLKWLPAIVCVCIGWNLAKADEAVDKVIQKLQSLRSSGLPSEIIPLDRTYVLLKALGGTTVDKSAAANELINWLFVKQPEPGTSEPFGLLYLHPAARSLVALGEVSVPLLTGRLNDNLSEEDAELILSCLKRIWQSQAAGKIEELAKRTSSTNVQQAAEAVLQGKEKTMNSFVYKIQKMTGD